MKVDTIKFKQLEWEKLTTLYLSESIGHGTGFYYKVNKISNDKYEVEVNASYGNAYEYLGTYVTLEQAQQAAQAHHDAFILSRIEV